MKRKIGAIVGASLLGLSFVVAASSPAWAAYENCSTTPFRVCTYTNSNGGGTLYYYTGPFHTCINIGGGLNDTMSSVKNTYNEKVKFYQNAGCGGFTDQVGPYCGGCLSDHINDMRNDFFNDTASSLWMGNDAP